MSLRHFRNTSTAAAMWVAVALLAAAPLFAQQVSIVTTSLPSATVGKSYSAALAASGGVQPYAWTVSGALPSGIVVNTAGALTGTPTTAGSYDFIAVVTDFRRVSASQALTLVVAAPLSITTASPLPAATVGQSYTATLSAAGGTPPYRWTAGPQFPTGFILDSQAGVITGTPTATGILTFPVQVVDSVSSTATASLTLPVNVAPLQITTVPPLFTGVVGSSYAEVFTASGGKPPYTWSISSGNAGGLTMDTDGLLAGTPQTAGTYVFTVLVTDSAGATASKSFSLLITPPLLTLVLGGALPPGAVAAPYNQKIPATAVGGTPPYRWSVGGSLAPGLAFDPSSLTLSGTPTAAGSFNFTLQVTDTGGQTASRGITLVVGTASLTITTPQQLPDGALNVAYSTSLAAAGGAPPYTWSAVGLPDGLSLNASTGEIAGTPTAAGNFAVAITVSDNSLARTSDRFTININLPTPPAVAFTGLPDTIDPAGQYSLKVSLAAPFPVAITGQALLVFSAETGPADMTVQFASGGTSVNFSIPAGSTTADAPLALQTGTTAGNVSVSLQLKAAGLDITPTPAPTLSGRITRAAPAITDARITRGNGTLSVVVSGYSTSREVAQATFAFTAASGQALQPSASSITVAVDTLFGAWYKDAGNSAYGTQFVLTQPFTVQGDPNGVLLQSVTLTNSIGATTFRVP